MALDNETVCTWLLNGYILSSQSQEFIILLSIRGCNMFGCDFKVRFYDSAKWGEWNYIAFNSFISPWTKWTPFRRCFSNAFSWMKICILIKIPLKFVSEHSVESPSMVDPQWNIWYWGSKWNLHTVCWSAVGCEWGTTSVYFGITYVCFIPSRLPVFAVEPQYLLQYFLFLSKVSFELHIQNLQKNHVGLKFEWGL